METKFSPGPWAIQAEDLRGGRYWSVYIPGKSIDGEPFEPVDIHESENGEANARLIAAAPELYEAVESAIAFIKDQYADPAQGERGEWLSPVARPLFDKLIDAYCKARGESS